MNWDAITAVTEVIGVAAVLASIIYLARQVSQGNELNRSDSIRNFLEQYNALLVQFGDPAYTEIWRRGAADFDSLNQNEQSWLHTLLFAHYMLGQAQRMIDPNGKDELSKFADITFITTISQPGTRQWWDTFKDALPDQDYVSRIDSYPTTGLPDWKQVMPWYINKVDLEARPSNNTP